MAICDFLSPIKFVCIELEIVITYPIPPKPTRATRVCKSCNENLLSSSAIISCRPTKSGSFLNGTVDDALIVISRCTIYMEYGDQLMCNKAG
jgi:hypothetical protein